MTLAAMIEVAERAWSRSSPCYRCAHFGADRRDPEMAACAILDYEAAVIEDCPAVAAALEKEIDHECERERAA